jgi:hypothetical protein
VGGKGGELDDSSRLDVVEIRPVPAHASGFVSFLVRLRTYQQPGTAQQFGCDTNKDIQYSSFDGGSKNCANRVDENHVGKIKMWLASEHYK